MAFYYNSRTSNESIGEVCSAISNLRTVELFISSIRYIHRFSENLSAIRLVLSGNNQEQAPDPNGLEFVILGKENYTPFLVELGVREYYEATKKKIIGAIDSIGRILGVSPYL